MKIQNKKVAAAMSRLAPSIDLSLTYTQDYAFQWDGDTPDPSEEGFDPYTVDVYAKAIVDGELIEGRDSLGGTYEKPGKFDKDIGGYLPQMLDQALADLLTQSPSAPVKKQVKAAQKWLAKYMRQQYNKQARAWKKKKG